MAATFRIDQATPGTGTADRSRVDLVDGEIITLVAISPGGGATYAWELLDKVNSTATLSAASGSTVTIGNAGLIAKGSSFLIKMTATEPDGTVSSSIRSAKIPSTRGVLYPLVGETNSINNKLGSNDPSLSTDNAVYDNFAGLGAPAQNWRGWAEAHRQFLASLEDSAYVTSSAGAPTVNDDSDAGYTLGFIWIDTTTDDVYLCGDATVGAAVWQRVGAVDFGLTPSNIGRAAAGGASGDSSRIDHVHDYVQAPTNVSSSPVTMSATDVVMLVDTSAARTINLPSPATTNAGREWFIIDKTGTAETYNITLARNGGTYKINGVAADYTLLTNFGRWRLWSDGTDYYTE